MPAARARTPTWAHALAERMSAARARTPTWAHALAERMSAARAHADLGARVGRAHVGGARAHADLGARVGRAHVGGARAQVDVASRVGQTVSDPAADAVLGGAAAGAGGAAVAVWSPPLDTPSPQVFAAVRAAAGSDFGPPETVSPPYREVATPTVGLDPRTGEALAAWVARTGERTQAVLAALRAPP